MKDLILTYKEIGNKDVARVGGKNASLGEMFNTLGPSGIRIPEGFATTAAAYWHFLESNNIREKLRNLMAELDTGAFANLNDIGAQARKLILEAVMPEDLRDAIVNGYRTLQKNNVHEVAVRSSATAEDLPQASFAGQHESYLNISGEDKVVKAVQRCFASLFTDRAIKYRADNGFDHNKIALSAGIQRMVRSDKACAGVGFTLEPESGFRNVVHIAGVWGLGENIVQGTDTPDEYYLFKPALRTGKKAVIQERTGDKSKTMVYAEKENALGSMTVNINTPEAKRKAMVLSEDEVTLLGTWALAIEDHYGCPMDIEWAKDGVDGKLYIVQARPETVHSRKNPMLVHAFHLLEKGKALVKGEAIGDKIATGTVRIMRDPGEASRLQKGDIVVTELTSPDWDPVLKTAAAIITDKGGRTSHASIIAREIGIPAVVGTDHATTVLQDGQQVTVCCAEGKEGIVYEGELQYEETDLDFTYLKMPEETKVMMILGDPSRAFKLSFYPNGGIGLMRIEFIINNSVQVHPMALAQFDKVKDAETRKKIESLTQNYPDKKKYFVDKLAQGVATIAAAFYPKEVIVRMSDFKTNEYRNLIGGKYFEPEEENPMLGFRGASRYYNPRYKEGFRLECEAMKEVRDAMGLTNVRLMIPFCRTVEEGEKVLAVMEEFGLRRGENELEIYVMAEIPSNVIQADEFAAIFDGFSIGSNDLTQLTLGIDRDSSIVSDLFNETNKSAEAMIATVIQKARRNHKMIGLCGQAPSDFPEYARFLVEQGISSISFNPDALLRGIENVLRAEKEVVPLLNEQYS